MVSAAPFHIEHIRPRQHGGTDDPENLDLSCHHCNLHKGPNLTGIDPETGRIEPLFHPRRDTWAEHVALQGLMIVGLTPRGRATARVLAMNVRIQIEIRSEFIPS